MTDPIPVQDAIKACERLIATDRLARAYLVLRDRLAAIEDDYQRIIREIIPHAQPAKERPDDCLEPPWEVVSQLVARLAAAEKLIMEYHNAHMPDMTETSAGRLWRYGKDLRERREKEKE